jgi:hypothetical protein
MTAPPACAACKTPLVIRKSGPMWVVLCWRCPKFDAIEACSETRALAEWVRQEAVRGAPERAGT